MAIESDCGHCGAHHSVPDNRAGLVTVCSCGADLQIPEPSFMGRGAAVMEMVDESSEAGTSAGVGGWERSAPRSSPEEILRRERERPRGFRRRDPTWKYRVLALCVLGAVAGLVYLGAGLRAEGGTVGAPPSVVRRFQIALAARGQEGLRTLLSPSSADLASEIARLPDEVVSAVSSARVGESRVDNDTAVVLASIPPEFVGGTRAVIVAFALRRADGTWRVDGFVTMGEGMAPLFGALREGDRAATTTGDRVEARVLDALRRR